MGRIRKGILGPVAGTVGTVIGGSWKGIYYLRSQPNSRKHKSTVDQLDHQLKFSIVINFLQTMTDMLRLTFKKYAIKMSEFNAAFSYNFENAITGTAPDYKIDFQKALVSRGSLPNASGPNCTATGGVLFFTWTDNSDLGSALPTDKAVLVAFCPGLNLTIYNTKAGVRSDASASLDVSSFLGETVETWIAFITADGAEASDSLFTGELVLGPA